MEKQISKFCMPADDMNRKGESGVETVNEFISHDTKMASRRVMQMVSDGRIRNHKMGDAASSYHNDREERELNNFMRFIFTRNFYDIMQLHGGIN